MSIEPTCEFCGISDKLRCKTEAKAKSCSHYIAKTGEDFGFSFEDDEVELQKKQAQTKAKKLYETIEKFLDNLARNPEKTTIRWPNRAEKIKEFKNKLKGILDE